ncbi:MAG: tRNA (adenosine(37)-N6)-dimethylallyltransferase MiaA [Odoribacteraceae bacterium]|jgi:tRNA dimethylallyltransferase|nr:tRNA (adenosine(37)-N6)-dimethylallyltransferase MiaA [Odoribacteraceae bacterium]
MSLSPGTHGTLVVLLGPTGVGKTSVGVELARALDTVILSCDSRQVYEEMCIGTAAPGPEELAAVPHFFVRAIPVERYYNCWEFERQALACLEELFARREVVLMVGGSMLYIDAVCRGMDEIPDVDPEIRASVTRLHEREGIESLRALLHALDPAFYREVDLKNARRVMHAVEICLTTGKPYSSLRTGRRKPRDFSIVKIGLTRDAGELRENIHRRVDQMVAAGLEEEARGLYPRRHLNALNTVGYKEWFDHFDGKISRDEAIRLIKRDTCRYAKKQLTWFRRDDEITWFSPGDAGLLLAFIRERAGGPSLASKF